MSHHGGGEFGVWGFIGRRIGHRQKDYTCCGEPNMRLERGLVRDGLFLSGVSVWV